MIYWRFRGHPTKYQLDLDIYKNPKNIHWIIQKVQECKNVVLYIPEIISNTESKNRLKNESLNFGWFNLFVQWHFPPRPADAVYTPPRYTWFLSQSKHSDFFGDLPWSDVNAEGQVAQVIFGSHKGQEWPFQSHKKSPRLFGFVLIKSCLTQVSDFAPDHETSSIIVCCWFLVFLCAHFSGHQNKDWH